jgi:hypothetical protein
MSLNPNLAARTKSVLMVGTATVALIAAIALPNFARAHTTLSAQPSYLTLSDLSQNIHSLPSPKAQLFRAVSQSSASKANR